jgi:hypothetical protein
VNALCGWQRNVERAGCGAALQTAEIGMNNPKPPMMKSHRKAS